MINVVTSLDKVVVLARNYRKLLTYVPISVNFKMDLYPKVDITIWPYEGIPLALSSELGYKLKFPHM